MSSSCGACKFLRRKCMQGCVFAPYFSYHQAASHFGAVHKVFGASNVSKLLLRLPVNFRSDAAVTIAYQALARIQDPAYGCVAYIMTLQQQVASIQQEIEILSHQLALNSVTSLASRGCLHASSTSNCETQLSPRPDTTTSTHCYQNQQNLQLDNSDHIAGSIEFDSKMTSELLPLYGWEDQNPFWNSAHHSLDELLKGVDC
ncbi:LOB domain-containing protein 33 [Linum grandiflorum]